MRTLEIVFFAIVLGLVTAILIDLTLPKRINLKPIALNLAARMILNKGKEVVDIGIPATIRLYSNRTLVVEYQGYIYKIVLPERSIYKIKTLASIDKGPIIEIYGRLNKTELIIWVGVLLSG